VLSSFSLRLLCFAIAQLLVFVPLLLCFDFSCFASIPPALFRIRLLLVSPLLPCFDFSRFASHPFLTRFASLVLVRFLLLCFASASSRFLSISLFLCFDFSCLLSIDLSCLIPVVFYVLVFLFRLLALIRFPTRPISALLVRSLLFTHAISSAKILPLRPSAAVLCFHGVELLPSHPLTVFSD
jgi:hypothetical protein